MSEEALTADRISELKARFATFDKEGNGLINSDDLISLLRCIGLNPSRSECDEFKMKCASDNNLVDFSMITTLVQNLGWDKAAEEQALADAFAEFDADKTGYLDISVIKKKLSSLGEDQLSTTEIDKLLSLSDQANNNGKVNYKELSAALMRR